MAAGREQRGKTLGTLLRTSHEAVCSGALRRLVCVVGHSCRISAASSWHGNANRTARVCVYPRGAVGLGCLRLHVNVGFQFRGFGAWGWLLASSVAMPRVMEAKACAIALMNAGRVESG